MTKEGETRQYEEYKAGCCETAKEKLLWYPSEREWFHYDDRFDAIKYCPWCGQELKPPDEQSASETVANEKRFPIQGAGTVPWKEAEVAYKVYVRFYGSGQTLEGLAKRGGFGISEFCCLYLGENPIRTIRSEAERMVVIVATGLSSVWFY